MPRFTVFRLILIIVASAGVFAALRASNDYWAGGVQLVTLALIGVAVLRSVQGRVGWLGFLVFCGGYFVAVRTLPDRELASLPTTIAISQGQRWFALPAPAATMTFNPTTMKMLSTTWSPTSSTAPPITLPSSSHFPDFDLIVSSLVDDSANYVSYQNIAQNLFALLFGWLGACFTWRSQARRAADQAGSTQGS